MAEYSEHSSNKEEYVDIQELLRILLARRWVVVSTAIFVTFLSGLIAFQLTPQYSATAKVLIDTPRTNIADVEQIFAGMSLDTSAIESQVQLIQSRSFLERVASELKLIEDPGFNPALVEDDTGLLAYLDPRALIGLLIPPEEQPELTKDEVERRQMTDILDKMSESLDVRREGLSYVIRIGFTSDSRRMAVKIANTIADMYVVEQLEAKFEATRRGVDWLDGRLGELRQQLRDAERAVEIYRAENNLLSADDVTISEQQLSELNAQLILAKTDRAEAEAKLAQAEQVAKSGYRRADAIPEVLASTLISNLREQEAELTRREAEYSNRYLDRHPTMVQLRAELSNLRSKIGTEISRIVQRLRNEKEVALTRERTLEQNLKDLQSQTAQANAASVRLRELEREAEGIRSVYEAFLSRFKESTNQEQIQEPDARVIAQASMPKFPSFPNKKLLIAGGGVLGGILGVLLAFALEGMDRGFRNTVQLEKSLGVPSLAIVPRLGRDAAGMAPQDYLIERHFSIYAEAFRSLLVTLRLSDIDNPPKVIAVTSALPGEGKTTTSVSLARMAAKSGTRTLLIDVDLRRPSVHKSLGLKNLEGGFLELLMGETSLEECIVEDPDSGLHILPIKETPLHPADLLGSDRMREFLDSCRDVYELVIIDSAPVLLVTDTRVLAPIVDKFLFVVEWENTARVAAQKAVKSLLDVGADIAGAVLNQVDTTKQARLGYEEAGAYVDKYKSYYVS